MRRAMAMLAAGAVLALAPPAAATDAERGTHTRPSGEVLRALSANGAVVAMPEIAGLSCRGMAETLRLIDESGYRGPVPLPQGHPDRPIFEYEDRLAATYYRDCIMAGHRLESPAPAFARGFETP